MVPELVSDHDPLVYLQVCYAIEILCHRRFLSSLMRIVLGTIDSTVELLLYLAYVMLTTPPTCNKLEVRIVNTYTCTCTIP